MHAVVDNEYEQAGFLSCNGSSELTGNKLLPVSGRTNCTMPGAFLGDELRTTDDGTVTVLDNGKYDGTRLHTSAVHTATLLAAYIFWDSTDRPIAAGISNLLLDENIAPVHKIQIGKN